MATNRFSIFTSDTEEGPKFDEKRNPGEDVRDRRHEGEERPSSGRRWTTSRNSPYQKIVSSYEQEIPAGGEQQMEDPAQAKAKIHKRKQWRTSAPFHDQIGSETSSDVKASHEEPTDLEAPRGISNGSTSRRRSATSHTRELEQTTEQSTSSNKKRRGRPATTSTTTTTAAPQTMSDTLYQYFRPLERDLPQDDIMPFLDFGRKLAPVIPTPSGANSIEGRTRITKLRPRNHHEDRGSNSSDEEMLQEDMDVTVVKAAIERNSVPRAKLRVREQGISDFYRKRVVPQVRTTENLISTSDSSTASPIPGSKNVIPHKKLSRHHIHHELSLKSEGQMAQRFSSELVNPHIVKSVEILPEKSRQVHRPVQKLAAIKLESSQSPLTAESTLVKTIIKDPSIAQSKEQESKIEKDQPITNTDASIPDNVKIANINPSAPEDPDHSLDNQSNKKTEDNKEKQKILSTAVVTSVSVQESASDESKQHSTQPPVEAIANENLTIISDRLPLVPSGNKSTSSTRPAVRSFISPSNFTSSIMNSTDVPVATNRSADGVKSQTAKNETPLRLREIYRPKAIAPGGLIPHLPRQIPIARPLGNVSVSSIPLEAKSTISPTESTTIKSETSPTTTEKADTTTKITSKTTTTARITTAVPQTITTPSRPSTTTRTDLPNHGTGIILPFVNAGDSATVASINDIEPTKSTVPTSRPKVTFTTPGQQPTTEKEFSKTANAADDESESVPPPKLYEEQTENSSFVSIESSYVNNDRSAYFTALPTATVPVVDTRPETEAAVVEEQKNKTTPRPAPDWVKIGAIEKDVEVVYPEPLGVGAYALAALGVVPIIMGALIGARFILAHNKKKVLDESEYSSEYNRSPLGISASNPMPTKLPRITTHVSWSEAEKSTAPSNSNTPAASPSVRWEFPRDKLRLQTLLGEGNFGQVWKAEADDISGHEGLTRLVAVKTVKESATNREREDLLRELGIMQELGSHPNVVTLLGCCTEKEPIYLIMEYVMYGKLLSFLRDHRTRAHYYNFSDATDALTSRDLTVFGYCVARGMDYLTNKSIIHRDLAARNVLVDHNKLCKIADFGMSRNVRDTGQIYEQRQSKGALPIRWMAPESLHFSLFTHKTDVWSFGILMWEIVTLGSTPYATMGAREVMRRVRDGYRLDRPSHCRPELFRVINQCWHSEPSKRPTFAELKVELGALLNDTQLRRSFVDLDSYADEMRRDSLHRHH